MTTPEDDPDSTRTTLRIPGSLVRRLSTYAEPLGMHRSQAIFALLDEALTRHELAAETRARIVRAQHGRRTGRPLLEDGMPHD